MARKFIFAVGIGFLVIALLSNAQEGGLQIVPTWSAENLYPSDYPGKPLPSEETPVVVSVEILRDGKLIDPSLVHIKWYVDGKYYKEGEGMKEMLFYASKRAGDSHFIRIVANLVELSASKIIEIPVVPREVVVESDAGGSAPANSSVTFIAVPYFFNVSSISDLDISWKIQKQNIPGENKNTLFVQFGTPQNANQGAVKVSSLIKEKNNVFQKATGDFLINIGQ